MRHYITSGYTSVQHASSLDWKTSTEGKATTKVGNLFQGSTTRTEKAAFLLINLKRISIVERNFGIVKFTKIGRHERSVSNKPATQFNRGSLNMARVS